MEEESVAQASCVGEAIEGSQWAELGRGFPEKPSGNHPASEAMKASPSHPSFPENTIFPLSNKQMSQEIQDGLGPLKSKQAQRSLQNWQWVTESMSLCFPLHSSFFCKGTGREGAQTMPHAQEMTC